MSKLDLRYGYISGSTVRLPVAHADPAGASAPARAYGTRPVRELDVVWDNATFWDWQGVRRHFDANPRAAFLANLPGYPDPVLVQHRQTPTGTPTGPSRLTVTVFLVEALATSEAT